MYVCSMYIYIYMFCWYPSNNCRERRILVSPVWSHLGAPPSREHYTGWLMGVLILAYYDPYIRGVVFHPLYTANNQGFGHCSNPGKETQLRSTLWMGFHDILHTLHETNSSLHKIDGWKMIHFLLGPGQFSGAKMLVSGRVYFPTIFLGMSTWMYFFHFLKNVPLPETNSQRPWKYAFSKENSSEPTIHFQV